jgi:hypothetical protein
MNYSEEIDRQARELAENETPKLNPKENHLVNDKVKTEHGYYCVSFLPPMENELEKIETVSFTYFMVQKMKINEMFNFIKEIKERYDQIENQDAETINIAANRLQEEMASQVLKMYHEYKQDNRVYLNNRMDEHLGRNMAKQPLQGAFKIRAICKSDKKALNKAKELSKKDGFTVMVGETGKWQPFNPDKFHVQNYESTNTELNELMRKTLEEREKAKNAFGLRTELLKRQGKKLAEDTFNTNLENIKKGMFDSPDNFLQKKISTNDISLTQIDDWSKDPNETEKVKDGEVNLVGIDPKQVLNNTALPLASDVKNIITI